MKGAYLLIMEIKQTVTIQIKSLGSVSFAPGEWVYVGSGMGNGSTSIENRLLRHFRDDKKIYWHIDYLRQAAQGKEVWLTPGAERREQAWVDVILAIPGAMVLVEGFGASDSTQESHLIYFDVRPLLEDFAVGVRDRFPEAQVLRAYADESTG